MSKVDLTVFEKLAEECNFEGGLTTLVYELSRGDLDEFCFGVDRRHYPDYCDYSNALIAAEAEHGYEWLEGETGGEGAGEYCYGVFKLGGKLYRSEWAYYSFHGCEFNEILNTLKEAKPVQKTITVYE